MPISLDRRKTETILPGYAQLLKEVRDTLLLGQEKIEREKVLTYWKTGKAIHRRTLQYKARADYGTQAIRLLARDLKIDDRLLYYSLRFARAFPILHARAKLTWTHYRELAAVPDQKRRLALAGEAERHGWTSDQLIERIRKELPDSNGQKPHSLKKEAGSFKPKRGTVGVWRVILSDVLLLDLGFSSFIEHPALKTGRFKAGDIVQVSTSLRGGRKADEAISVLKGATPSDLFTYQAEVEKVVDGDTLWLWIHAGFDLWVRQKVRLRGIDTPELDSKAGLAAKRFVESQLEPIKEIIVTTTKPDKFDRYLSDVWVGDVNLNKLLLEFGHARLESDSSSGWTALNWGRF